MFVYVLLLETSDQYGTERVVAVFSSPDLARMAAATYPNDRRRVQEMPVDPIWPYESP